MLFGWGDYTYDVKNNKRVLAASASSEKAHITVVLATTAADLPGQDGPLPPRRRR